MEVSRYTPGFEKANSLGPLINKMSGMSFTYTVVDLIFIVIVYKSKNQK